MNQQQMNPGMYEEMGEPMGATGMGEARDKLVSDFRALATHAEELIRATAELSEEGIMSARERLADAVQTARARLMNSQSAATARARRAADVTDTYVHEKPWPVIGVALILGVLLGFASAQGRHH